MVYLIWKRDKKRIVRKCVFFAVAVGCSAALFYIDEFNIVVYVGGKIEVMSMAENTFYFYFPEYIFHKYLSLCIVCLKMVMFLLVL